MAKKTEESDLERFRTRLRIDRNGLDQEFLELADLFFQVAEHQAYAISRRDGLKDEIKRVDAVRREAIRLKLEEEGVKPTEKMLDALVLQDHEHLQVQEAQRAASLEADLWDGMREAWRRRAAALESLAQLHGQAYFMPDSAKSKMTDQAYERQKFQAREVREKSQRAARARLSREE